MRTTLLLLTLMPAFSSAQSALFQFSIDEGLTRSNVSAIFEDSRGILWVGTEGAGLYQLAGGRFVQDPELLRHTGYDIIRITESSDGVLYIESAAGVIRYDGHIAHVLSLLTPDVHDMVVCGSDLWYSDSAGVYRLTDGKNHRITQQGRCLMECVEGRIMSISQTRVMPLGEDDEVLASFPAQDWIASATDRSTLLLASATGKVLQIDDDIVYEYDVPLENITSISIGALGDIWLGSASGLYVYHPVDEILQPMRDYRRLAGHINTLYFDRQDRLWIGTRDHGLLQYRGEPVTRTSMPNAAASRFARDRGSRQNALWLINTDGTVSRYDATQASVMEWQPAGVGNRKVKAFFPDRFDRKWYITPEGSLKVEFDTLSVDLGKENAGPGIAMMSGDPAGRMWIESADGTMTILGLVAKPGTQLLTFEGHQVTGDSLVDQVVSLIPHDKFEMVRVGIHSLSTIVDGTCKTHYRTERQIRSATVGPNGILWLGLSGGGVMKVALNEPVQPATLIAPRFLQPYDILFIHKEKSTLWLGTERSILRLRLDASETGIDEVTTVFQSQSAELGPGRFTFTTAGIIAVLTSDGMLQIPTASAISTQSAPQVYISSVALSGQEIQNTVFAGVIGGYGRQIGKLVLPYRENSIAFSYSAASTEAGPLTFQWKLAGVFDTWSAPSARNIMQFVGLAPGSYSFDVRVCNALGKCSVLEHPWEFTIRRALIHFWWFWALIAAVAVAVAIALVNRRVRTVRRQGQREQERLRMEVKTLEMEQKALQLQMNPHFLFNVLQTIQSQLQRNHFAKARHSLSQFSRLMRSMLEINRRKEITLEEEIEFLKLYLEMENACRSKPFEYHVTVGRNVETFAIAVPPMLIQPIVENAIKHGTTADDPRIDIELYDDRDAVTCIVRDNGRGIAREDLDKKDSAALDIVAERLLAMGARGALQFSTAKGGGAEVTLIIPVRA